MASDRQMCRAGLYAPQSHRDLHHSSYVSQSSATCDQIAGLLHPFHVRADLGFPVRRTVVPIAAPLVAGGVRTVNSERQHRECFSQLPGAAALGTSTIDEFAMTESKTPCYF